MKILIGIFTFIMLCSITFAQNPYEQFGCEGRILQTEMEKSGTLYYEIISIDSSLKLLMDFDGRTVFVLDSADNILASGKLIPVVVKRWMSRDPLESKFPSMSPYNAMVNNPVIVIDPDGREGIVVSGEPGDVDEGGHSNKEHFLINGLDRAKKAKKHFQRDDEEVTWIIYDDGTAGGQDPDLLKKYKKKANAAGINVMVVDDVDEIVDYVNDKKGDDTREDDQITSFYYLGHALLGDLSVGYGGSGEDFEPSDFDEDAFASGTHINLIGGCRTHKGEFFDASCAHQFRAIVDSKSDVYSTDVRVFYPGGVVTDEQLVKKNNGKIIHEKGVSDILPWFVK